MEPSQRITLVGVRTVTIVGIGCIFFSVLAGSMGGISLLKMYFYNHFE